MMFAASSKSNRRLALAAIAACAALPGCGGAERPVAIVVSGDTGGWIVPCGCTSNQSGGLPRRATYLSSVRKEADLILVDAGGAALGASLYDQLKFAAILRGEKAMGVAAHNVGASEAALGAEVLRRVARETGVALLSANATDQDGQPLGEPSRVVRAGGRRILLVGVLSQRHTGPHIRVAPPGQAIRDELRKRAGQFDACVALAYLPEEELQPLAESIPELDIVCGGPTGQPIAPQVIGPVLLASATRQGKFLARFDAAPSHNRAAWKGQIVELDGQYADDPQQAENVAALYEELARRDLAPADTSFAASLAAAPASYRIAGDARCAACHEPETHGWRKSRHAQAWASLQAKAAQVNPDCQRCHTTGYGQHGGFAGIAKSKDRVNVGCESCHGPSLAHAENEKLATAFRGQAADRCRDCHDKENSPKFEFASYWSRVRHGPAEGVPQTSSRSPLPRSDAAAAREDQP